MSFQVKFGTEHLDWSELCLLFERAPLGRREPARLRRAAENSHLVCSAYDGDTLIGFARALTDGEYQSAIYDMVVLPEYQGRGVGKTVMNALLAALPTGTVLIYVVPGKEGFYAKLGFNALLTGMGRFPDLNEARRKRLIP